MIVEIVVDLLVLICLGITLLAAFQLNKKLVLMYKNKKELEQFLDQFTKSMQKADQHIRDLKGIGDSVFKTAQTEMDRAAALKDDLMFLTQRGDDLASSLETQIRQARDVLRALQEYSGDPASSASLEANAAKLPQNDDGGHAVLRALQSMR